MAYNNFTLNKLKADFDLEQQRMSFLPQSLPIVKASQRLLDELSDALVMPIGSEKAKSEFIVKPILAELVRLHKDKITLFSGYTFDVDKAKKLTGRCDFMIANQPHLEEVNAPIFCLVEAKNGLIEDAFGQCAAEMYAARILNEKQGAPTPIVYGCATIGFLWAFLRLETNILTIDPAYMGLNLQKPENILSVLDWIVKQY